MPFVIDANRFMLLCSAPSVAGTSDDDSASELESVAGSSSTASEATSKVSSSVSRAVTLSSVGQACLVVGKGRGVIRWFGILKHNGEERVGVELDKPVGKNDGSLGEEWYFSCPENHGLFAPVNMVTLT